MSGFKKNDVAEGKPDWSLLPLDGCEGIVRILMAGAKKYDRDNWRQGQNDLDAKRRMVSACMRHLAALERGEKLDPESGENHILHAACNLLFLASFAETARRETAEILSRQAQFRFRHEDWIKELNRAAGERPFVADPDQKVWDHLDEVPVGPAMKDPCDIPNCPLCPEDAA